MLIPWTTAGAAGAVATRSVLGTMEPASSESEEEEEEEEDMATAAVTS
jgi:hypothetical protein